MKTTATIIGALALVGSLAGPAAAADKVPVKLKLKGCDGCRITATWTKSGKVTGKYRSKTKVARSDNATLKYRVPKGYYLYFAGTSARAQTDAATILVTQFVGQQPGSKVSPAAAQQLRSGAYYCLTARKGTIKARAALVPAGKTPLLALWANPQLAALGPVTKTQVKGVYGTQNVLPCVGGY